MKLKFIFFVCFSLAFTPLSASQTEDKLSLIADDESECPGKCALFGYNDYTAIRHYVDTRCICSKKKGP